MYEFFFQQLKLWIYKEFWSTTEAQSMFYEQQWEHMRTM